MNVQSPQFLGSKDDDPAGLGTGPVPAGPYYQPEYFDLEREAIFKRTWLHIGHVCELPQPGSFIVRHLDFASASILITRAKDGLIRAFHNVCTHRGTQLVMEPDGTRSSFTCPYHAWNFGNDGRLRAAPDMERFYVDKKDCGLVRVALDSCAGLLFVNLDPSPKQSLREFIGEELVGQLGTRPVARATTFSEYVYEIEANWKITYDNFQENYHLRFIHPRSGAAAGGPDNPFGYPTGYGFYGPHRTQAIWSNPAPGIQPVQGFALARNAQLAYTEAAALPSELDKQYFALFPNFFLFGMPGSHFSHTVIPISATRSRGVIRLYWIGDDDSATRRFAREYGMCTAFDIHSEDRAVIEAGQRGLNSGALKYIHLQSQEVLLRHLFTEVDKRVQAYRTEQAK